MRLRVSRPSLRLFCIGEGPLQAELEARAIGAGLADRIHFLGSRGSLEVATWLAAANVFCLPSYAEGCPNSVIEALACGRPVVATNVGGIPELVNSESGNSCCAPGFRSPCRGSRQGIVATMVRNVDFSAGSAQLGPGCRRDLRNLHGVPRTPRPGVQRPPFALIRALRKFGKLKVVNRTEKSVPRPDGNRALLLPLAFTFGLAGFALLPPVRQNPRLLITFLGAAAALCAWNAILFVWARRSGRMSPSMWCCGSNITCKPARRVRCCCIGDGIGLRFTPRRT